MDIGEKLRRLRIQRNLTQEEMADRCELSKGFISQVERNLASPSIATLTDMLECLGSDLKTFFSEAEQEEKIVFEPADMFEKTNEETLHGSHERRGNERETGDKAGNRRPQTVVIDAEYAKDNAHGVQADYHHDRHAYVQVHRVASYALVVAVTH